MFSTRCCVHYAALIILAAAAGANDQVSSINSAVLQPRVFNDVPGATYTGVNNYPMLVLLGEQGVSAHSGYANRDVWNFSANGGLSAYQFQNNDYFNASFGVTLTGGSAGYDLEAGFLFSNPSGTFGGDLQIVVNAAGTVVQFGGPSFYPFSPIVGGTSVPNYVPGETYTLGLNYVIDPKTGQNAFQYSVNGQFAASSLGNAYFDLGPGVGIGGLGNYLGGYFQIQTDAGNPSNSGTALFDISIVSVPEPATLALLGLGILTLVFRRRGN